jgi:hypothetical protein
LELPVAEAHLLSVPTENELLQVTLMGLPVFGIPFLGSLPRNCMVVRAWIPFSPILEGIHSRSIDSGSKPASSAPSRKFDAPPHLMP